jgi:hypothetical protein
MKWIDKLEQKYGHWALDGLIRYISFLMFTVFFLNSSGLLSYQWLYLDRYLIVHHFQIWRLFTFLLIPPTTNLLFLIFALLIMVMCADGLEAEWGTFKLTMYYFVGAAFQIIVALFLPQIQTGSWLLYTTLFLGFATLYPDYELLLFFIIPVKIKYLAMLTGFTFIYLFFTAGFYVKLSILLSLGNYILFFWQDFFNTAKRNMKQRQRQAKYADALKTTNAKPRNCCSVCNRTEITHPDLEFRYCTCKECGKNGKAFCMEHLEEHKAKNKEN